MIKALGETQRLRAGRSNAEPNIFAPLQTPFPEAQDGQNLINWRWSLPSLTDPVWWKSMHAISSYRGNRPTIKNNARLPVANTQTGPITIHCAAKLSLAQCNDKRLLLQVFIVYVRPVLEYCWLVWSPFTKKILTALKRYNGYLQRPGLKSMTYTDRLKCLPFTAESYP